MIHHYLRIALRVFRRNKLYSLINIGCLAIGIAVAMTILLYVLHEHSYDRWQRNGDRIFSLSATHYYGASAFFSRYETAVTGPMVKAADGRVESYVRAHQVWDPPVLQRAGEPDAKFKVDQPFYFADSNFFQFFSYHLLRGDPSVVLSRPFTVVLSERAARRFFGSRDPVGKLLLYNDSYRLEVTGIAADPPSNSSLDFDAIASISSLPRMKEMAAEWQFQTVSGGNFLTWFELRSAVDSAQVEATVDRLGNEPPGDNNGNKDRYCLTALPDVHLKANFGDSGETKYLTVFPLVAMLILLLALTNYMSLATARATVRAKEVGVRKVLGAGRGSVAAQFYAESTVYAVLAFLIGIGLFLVLRPYFLRLIGLRIDTSFLLSPSVLGCFLALLLFVVFVSGSYPSLVLSAFRPVAVLYGKLSRRRGGEYIRKGFLVFQFTISMALIVCSVIIQKEMYYIRHTDTGVDRENVLLIHFNRRLDHYPALRHQVEALPGIVKTATADFPPYYAYTGFMVTPKPPRKPFLMPILHVDNHFINLLGLQWRRRPADSNIYDGRHVVLNEEAIASLGQDGNPIGQTVDIAGSKVISGVLRNFNYQPLRGKIGPLCLVALSDADSSWGISRPGYLMAKVGAHVNLPSLLASIRTIYSSYDRSDPFDYSFLDELFDKAYKAEDQLAGLFGIFTAVTVIIAVMGLFSLATFAARQRLKEIGIRKVLGASVASISSLLSRDFLQPIALSVLIASPLAWWLMHKWLQNYAYRTPLSWWIFPAAGLGLLLVAQLTVLVRTIRAAQSNPTINLRSE